MDGQHTDSIRYASEEDRRKAEALAASLDAAMEDSVQNWGVPVALQTRNRLLTRFADVGIGKAIGHERLDIRISRTRLLLYLNESPFVLVYDPESRVIIRVLHQARDLPKRLR